MLLKRQALIDLDLFTPSSSHKHKYQGPEQTFFVAFAEKHVCSLDDGIHERQESQVTAGKIVFSYNFQVK